MEHELTEEIRSFIRHQKLIIERLILMSQQLDQLRQAQADTAQAFVNLVARLPVPTPPEDLTPAIEAEQALKAQVDAILPVVPPTP